jgi:hypothetical protein
MGNAFFILGPVLHEFFGEKSFPLGMWWWYQPQRMSKQETIKECVKASLLMPLFTIAFFSLFCGTVYLNRTRQANLEILAVDLDGGEAGEVTNFCWLVLLTPKAFLLFVDAVVARELGGPTLVKTNFTSLEEVQEAVNNGEGWAAWVMLESTCAQKKKN